MLNCEICKKNKVFVCSDKKNAWCQNGCGNYFHYKGNLLFLGNMGFNYPVRENIENNDK